MKRERAGRRERLKALGAERAQLKRQAEGLWTWLRNNVNHPQFAAAAYSLHERNHRIAALDRRMDNIKAGRAEYGDPLPTPTPTQCQP